MKLARETRNCDQNPARLAVGSSSRCETIVKRRGVEYIVNALRRHSGDIFVQLWGARALGVLVYHTDRACDEVLDVGGVNVLLDGMRAHVSVGLIQEAMTRTLSHLVDYSAENSDAIVAAGGVGTLVAGMRAHVGEEDIQEFGALALGLIANKSSGDVVDAVGVVYM